MTTNEIIYAVRVNMDEIADNDAEFATAEDSSELDEIIESKIGEAMLYIYQNAREDLLDNALLRQIADVAEPTDDAVTVQLDFKYARLVSARLGCWRGAIRADQFISEGTEDEFRVTDPVSGSSYQRPAVIEMFDPTESINRKKLMLLGTKNDTENYRIVYVMMPNENAEDINLGDKLNGALINYITGLVWTTYNEKERAQEMFELAVTQMGIDLTKKEE